MIVTAAFADLQQWRAETPGCRARVHLNNAGASLMPEPVLVAMLDHLCLEAEIGGYEAADGAAPQIEAVYHSIARLIGAQPRNIAVVENATVAFAQALSAFDFRPGDRLLTTRNDYVSNQLMYISLARRCGIEIVRAADSADGGVDPDSVRDLIRHRRPRLVAVTHVPTNSGLVQPVEAIGEVCETAGVPYLVDACQAVGQLELDVGELRCDYLAATARKFLRGPRGVGFLFVSDRALQRGDHPLLVDMQGADWITEDRFELVAGARRFENWEFAYALTLGMGAAASYAGKVGVARAGSLARGLADHVRRRLQEMDGVRVLDRGRQLCAIVSAEVADQDGRGLVERLRDRGINTSAILRGYAVIDMDDKGASSALRISPHYFNTADEVEALVDALAEVR